MPLIALLGPDHKLGLERQQPRPGTSAKKHLLQLQRQLAKQGTDAHCLSPYVLDVFGIKARAVAAGSLLDSLTGSNGGILDHHGWRPARNPGNAPPAGPSRALG